MQAKKPVSDGTEEIAGFIFKEDLGMFVKNTSLPHSPPKQWITSVFVWKLKILPKRKKNPSAFLKTDTKSMEMFFLTNEVKTASSLPRHCPNLNSLKDASWNSENPVAHYTNITSCHKNLTCFISVFVIPAFSLDKKITVPNSNIKPCVTSH